MGILDRFRSAGRAVADNSKVDTSGKDALRLVDEGNALEDTGRIEEAMQCYLAAIRLSPNLASAHLGYGNILMMKGNWQGALDAYRTAIKHDPDYASAHNNMGYALLSLGQFDGAVASYRRLLEIKPDFPVAHNNLGNALKGLGQLDNAVASYRRALEFKPDYVEAHYNLGVAVQGLGQLDEAVAIYHQVLAIKPDSAEVHYNLGLALQHLGKFDGAVASYRRALAIKPDFAEAHCNLGSALKDLGQLDDAMASYRRALAINPNLADAHNNLGNILKDLNKFDEAVASYRQVLGIKPDLAETHNNLGIVLQDLGQLDEAVASYRRAFKIKPDYAEAYHNLGVALQDLGQFDSALTHYQQALKIKPDYAIAHFNLGMLLLYLGQYIEAWPEYEARYDPSRKESPVMLPKSTYPQWQGEPLAGKSIVIWPEQGFGDEIQFSRYIPLLKTKGASRITLVCRPPLKELLGTVRGVDAVVPVSEAASLPLHDYWSFSMSLPLHFATTVETIPAELPYLNILPERLGRWRGLLPASGLKVGLVWKGSAQHKNDANRSLPSLATLGALWHIPGVAFVSLQKGQGEEEAATPTTNQPIIPLGSDIGDFADAAAIVSQLDMVICIDTAIAHLAGALNKPCWVLLPALRTDWRWFLDRTDSPWYPGTMRLFRQKKSGDWETTIGEVAKELRKWVEGHGVNR